MSESYGKYIVEGNKILTYFLPCKIVFSLSYTFLVCFIVSEYLFKFLVIGSAGTGKSSLLNNFIGNKCKFCNAFGVSRFLYWTLFTLYQ